MYKSTSADFYDVIVVGGGPSGLFTSSLLASKGLKTLLIEKENKIGKNIVCSGVISREAFTRYNLPEEAVVARLSEARLYSPGDMTLDYAHPEEAVFAVDRHMFDSLLAEAARKNGAEIVCGTRAASISVCGTHAEVRLKNTGGTKTLRSRLVVIATGISYNLQKSLGMGRPKKIIKGIQIEVEASDVDRLRIYWGSRVSDGFFGWAIPLDDGRTRVGVMTERHPLQKLKHVLGNIGPYVNICTDIGRIKRRGIAFGSIGKSYADRVLTVGEAAGLVKTTTGGGIYYGLISAEMAAEVAAEAFRTDDFSSAALSQYEDLWKSELAREISVGAQFHSFYSKLSDDSIDALFDAADKDGLLSFISQYGKFDWHRNAVMKILRSPNLRRVLLWQGINSVRTRMAL